MHDFTNLGWPETPFGADQRPFGQHVDMLAACTFDWTPGQDGPPRPVAVSLVYLRIRRRGSSYQVSDDTLSIGFYTTVIDDAAEVPRLLTVADRALTRARRHAAIVAGHQLGADLARINALAEVPLRGVDGMRAAWNDQEKQRGLAVIVDTGTEAGMTGADLGTPLEPTPMQIPECRHCAGEVARRALARCLAVGLTAALHTSRYTWEGTFRVPDAIERAGWDVLSSPGEDGCPAATGRDLGERQLIGTMPHPVAGPAR
ncbi:hypothetical protein Ahu01nite_078840 [Winogradskya humida]|uniref:Uncharacterized protein n=1 Tax=Winogradskya humida TaxID=113566 RepID=A0ABQ4A1P9_9ACTN|nr:hypothetical protein Ahu01nite_078840 [Actinoplanes humidus]